MPRTGLDYALAIAAGMVVVALVGFGVYGTFTGFLQTTAYLEAYEWVALGVAVVGAGCTLYLMMELSGPVRGRLVFAVCLIAGMFSYFSVSKGVPAAVTMVYGRPDAVWFQITGFSSAKNCSLLVIAKNAGYEDFRMCAKYLDGVAPEIGRHVYVHGRVSTWGIVRDAVEVRA